ncbi:MAG: hypothetical protein JSW33_00450 [bacterium]|nr:MAG: hypothetical protein JSW33_00450 [bacterium]
MYKFFLLIISLLIFFSCSEDPHQLILNVYDKEIPGVVKDTTLLVVSDTTRFHTSRVNTQFSLRLGFGSVDTLECRPIIRFTDYSTIPDSAQIDSAWIYLDGNNSISNGNVSPITARLHPILGSWKTNLDEVWNDYTQNIDRNTLLAELQISPDDTNNYTFTLNDAGLELARTWADTATSPDENFGLIIDFDQANFIQYFSAINSGGDPVLFLQYSLPSDTAVYRDTLLANYDAFLYKGGFPRESDRNYSSSLIEYHTTLDFDFSSFLAAYNNEVTILSANLQLPVDLNHSLIDPLYDISNIVVLKLDTLNLDSLVADSSTGLFARLNNWSDDSSYIEIGTNDNRTTLSTMIRQKLSTGKKTASYIISVIDDASNKSSRVSHEKEQFCYLSFFTYKDPDLLKRARLQIEYWVPAKPRI